ncbi:MAG: hypothetical protein KatS3mg105_0639 [Gemmatales bacterium]|nr:MAG: hypothetical protein KatS3mg105_0639 [Gemmatales bacterium]
MDRQTDLQLLDAFFETQNEGAFAEIVRRHGPMVWGVCLRLIRDRQLAEDAFQAVFLVLAKAGDKRKKIATKTLAPWLYGVARKIALRAGGDMARRQQREKTTGKRQVQREEDPYDVAAWRDLRGVVDGAIECLPKKYREPVILCLCEGKSKEQAAKELGQPVGTISAHLARGRKLLQTRLRRLGIEGAALSGVLIANQLAVPISKAQIALAVHNAASWLMNSSASIASLPPQIVQLSKCAQSTILKPLLLAATGIATATVGVALAVGYRPFAETPPVAPEIAVENPSYTYAPYLVLKGHTFYEIPDKPELRLRLFSIAAWFRTTQSFPLPRRMIVTKGGFGDEQATRNNNYGLWFVKDKLEGGFETSTGKDCFVTSPVANNDGQWHYAVVSFDGTSLRLYVDGRQVAETSLPEGTEPDSSGTLPVRIGANSLDHSRFFVGDVDEVRIWNRALSEEEVSRQFHHKEFSPMGQLLYVPFDEP